MTADPLASELAARFPLIEGLRFSSDDRPGEGASKVPSGIGLVLAALDAARPSGCCFVLANKTNVAHIVAALTALTRTKARLPQLLRDFAQRGFQEGQLVQVLPTGHVYQYGGFFPAKYGDFFRLCVLDRTDGEARLLPVSEILRLTEPVNENETLASLSLL